MGKKIKSLTICGIPFEVLYDNSIWSHGHMGRCNTIDCQIMIRGNMPDANRRSTILHEVLHIISAKMSLDLSEAQVSALEAGLYPLIANNELSQ